MNRATDTWGEEAATAERLPLLEMLGLKRGVVKPIIGAYSLAVLSTVVVFAGTYSASWGEASGAADKSFKAMGLAAAALVFFSLIALALIGYRFLKTVSQ